MGRIVGIDLGTTNTAVAVMQDGRPKVIEDDRGYKVLPSVVSARGEGRFIVGQAAASLILTHPDRTVYATKRLIGRRFDSPEVQRAKARLQYEIRPAPDGGVQLRVGEDWMTPAEVAAVVLQVARTIAEKAIGEEVDEAVITVPAYFNHQQRAQTMEAAHIAGLRCERLLNEPTAAALAYGHRKNIERTLVIFDLGGGTFDCSVLRLSGGIYEILATGGDTYLGGEDFDYRLVDHLADQFQTRTGIDLRGDRAALQRLKDAAERAKCELSFSDKTNIVVPHISPSETLQTALSRQTLEALTTDLIQRCVDIAQRTVGEAGLQLTDVDDVILVGGQTRMPKVRETVSGVFGREPSRTVHPEEAVAIGASVHAASLADPDQPQAVLLDVTPFDLGIDSAGGMFSSIVTKNSRIPCAESRTFATVNDNQTQVRVTVRQGESRTAVENEFLGEFVMENLQPAPRLQTKVDVTFRIDNNGMLAVTATERATNHRAQITVRNYAERANQPRMPSREEVEAEKESRAKGSAATEVAPTEGGKKKSGLLSSLFGGGKKQKAEKTAPVAAAAAVAAAVPVAAAAAGAAGATPPPASPDPTPLPPDPGPPAAFAPPPAIDLSDIPVAGLEDVTDMATDAPVAGAAPLDDDDLFEMTEGPVQFGLAGGGSAGGGFAGGFDEVLDSNDLFAGMESTLDPHSVGGREPTDPFGRTPFDDAGQTDPFARPPSAATPGDAPSLYLPGAVADEPSPDDDFGILEEEPEPTAFPAKIRRDVPPPPMVQPQGLLFHGVDDVAPTETADAPADLGGLFDLPSDTGRRLPPPVDKDELDLGSLEDLFDSGTSSERPPMRFAAEGPPDPTHAGDEDAAVALGFAEPERPPTRVVSAPLGIPPIAEEVSSSRAPIITARKPKKPARLKLHYREREAFVTEYRDNLRRGGTFIRTDKPLAVGRECVFEIDAPGLTEPIVFGAVVSAISAGGDGTPPGMTIEYRMDPVQRDHIERVLARI